MSREIPCHVPEFSEWAEMPRVRDLTHRVRVGDLVVLRSRGSMRLARVTKVGTQRLYTEYTTESAKAHAAKYGHLTVTRKSVRMDDDFLRYAGKEV